MLGGSAVQAAPRPAVADGGRSGVEEPSNNTAESNLGSTLQYQQSLASSRSERKKMHARTDLGDLEKTPADLGSSASSRNRRWQMHRSNKL